MGAYLSEPVTEKISKDEHSDQLSYGASSMQGWRVSQEDAHNCIIDFDTNTSFFAVYDGHGGAEVAQYCAMHLPDSLRSMWDYKNGNFGKALENAFLEFDASLTKPEVISELKQMAGLPDTDEESVEDARMLREEACMPLDEVLARYETSGVKKVAPHVSDYEKPKSPMLRGKKAEASCDQNGLPGSSKSTKFNKEGSNSEPATVNGEVDVKNEESNSEKDKAEDGSSESKVKSEESNSEVSQSKSDSKDSKSDSKDPESDSKDLKSDSKDSKSDSKDPKSDSKDPKSDSKDSKSDSKDSKSDSKDSKSDSKDPKSDSKDSKSDSKDSKSDSKDSKSDSKDSKSDSKDSKTDAKESKTDSKDSETDSKDPKTNSKDSKTDSKDSTSDSKDLTDSKDSKSDSKDSKSESKESGVAAKESKSNCKEKPKVAPKKSKTDSKMSKLESSEAKTQSAKNDLVQPGCSSEGGKKRGNKKGSYVPAKPASDEDDDSDEDDEEYSTESDSSAAVSGSEDEDEENEGDSEDEEEESDEDEQCGMMQTSGEDQPGIDGGCTAVVALLSGDQLYVANAGDSRCVVSRGGKAVNMSFDHKPEDEVEMKRIVKAGGTVSSDGRVNGGLNLSRAIGDHAYKDNEGLSQKEQMITAFPDIQTLVIDPKEDTFMVLACDGIWNCMSSQEVVDFVNERLVDDKELSSICEEMFEKCLAPDTYGDGTGCDNMTVIIVKFHNLKKQSNKRHSDDSALSEEQGTSDSKKLKTDESA